MKLPPLKIGIPLMVLVCGLFAAVVSFFFEQVRQARRIEERFTERLEYLGTQVAVMSANFLEVGAQANGQREVTLAASAPGVRFIHVLDDSDRVIFSSQYEALGNKLEETRLTSYRPLIDRTRKQSGAVIELQKEGASLVGGFTFPIALPGGDLRSRALGVVLIEFDLSYAKAMARSDDVDRLQIGGVALLTVCAIFMWFFHRTFTARVGRLAAAARQLAEGKLCTRSKLQGHDELAHLSRAFDDMSTQLQRRDAELLESELRFRQMAENINEIFWLYDFDEARVLYANAAFEEIFGRPVADLMKSTRAWHDAVHPEDRERVLASFRSEREGPRQLYYRIFHTDGSTRWIRDRSFPIPDRTGRVQRVAGIAADITAQRMAADEKAAFDRKLQETQRLESLGVLAGGIAHDFNNLLTGVLGNASLARLVVPQHGDAQRYLGEIESVAVRAAELCKQMLAYSGKGRFEVQLLDLSTLVQETAQLLNLSIEKNAVLRFNLSKQLPPIMADPTQLRQVVMNLVINASEALGGKSGTISLHTGILRVDRSYLLTTAVNDQIEEGDYVFLEVADNGCGMDAATLSRIFEPFFTTKFTGRGLGLSAVLGIVRGHRGALKSYSEPGKGTMFKLLFPVAEGHAQAVASQEVALSHWKGTGHVLVVDDEETVRVVAARMLESFGFSPVLACDGVEGVRRYQENGGRFVAVLMDLTMPHMDGEAAFRRLRQLDPHVRVILMSGFNEQEAINRFTGKGLAGFLQKPFKPEQLRIRLQQLLRGSTI